MSSALNSTINRIEQLSQIREVTLEASVANAETGEVLHGSAAVYSLAQGRYSTMRNRHVDNARIAAATPTGTAATNTRVLFDLADASDRDQLRLSVSNRKGGRTMPNRAVPVWGISAPHQVDANRVAAGDAATPPACSADTTTLTAEVAAEAAVPKSPFPTGLLLRIIASQVLSAAPATIFAAVSPYIYGLLVGDFQTAGTVSSIATGGSMLLQVLLTPVLAQVMDMYGRKSLAMFSSLKAVIVVAPLLVVGIIVHIGMEGVDVKTDGQSSDDATAAKLGFLVPDESKRNAIKFFFALYWALSLLSSATSTSQSIVAIADVCPSQQQRCAAIGIYAALMYTLAAFAVLGAQLSLLGAAAAAVGVSLVSIVWTYFLFPETVGKEAKAGMASPLIPQQEEERHADSVINATEPLPTSSVNRRRMIYPSQVRSDRDNEALKQVVVGSNGSGTGYGSATANITTTATVSSAAAANEEDPSRILYPNTRRITFCVNPFKGIVLFRKSQTSLVALGVLFTCLMAEISASDTLVYYLSLTLNFGPSDISYLQIEQAVLAVVVCGILGPIVSKHLSCATLSMLCSVAIVSALMVLALAKTKILIYVVFCPCISLASIMMPSIAAVITKDASTPEDVSLSMSTVMALVALLQAGGSFLAALIFKSLSQEYLYVTFIISAAFTIPMFGLSVYLRVVCRREEAAKAAEAEAAAEEQSEKTTDTAIVVAA